MDATQIIRATVTDVSRLRQSADADPKLAAAILAVKSYQSLRFEHSYRDLIAGGPYQSASRFFLKELYGTGDYSRRDAQFSRIASAIERLLPQHAVATAVALARLHGLTEQLDFQMGAAWASGPDAPTAAQKYVLAWKDVGSKELRLQQLQLVLAMGRDLDDLTRTPGLRLVLKMMRTPAKAAGLPELQQFLETGFDTFAAMTKQSSGAADFLRLIEARESELISALFDPDFDTVEAVRNGVLPAGRLGSAHREA